MRRGVIRDRRSAEQGRDFSGLLFSKGRTPSDIDGSLDIDGKYFVFMELKYMGARLQAGQRKNLESLCYRIERGGGRAIVLWLSHETPSEEQIPVADSTVIKHYTDKIGWSSAREGVSCRSIIEEWLDVETQRDRAGDLVSRGSINS